MQSVSCSDLLRPLRMSLVSQAFKVASWSLVSSYDSSDAKGYAEVFFPALVHVIHAAPVLRSISLGDADDPFRVLSGRVVAQLKRATYRLASATSFVLLDAFDPATLEYLHLNIQQLLTRKMITAIKATLARFFSSPVGSPKVLNLFWQSSGVGDDAIALDLLAEVAPYAERIKELHLSSIIVAQRDYRGGQRVWSLLVPTAPDIFVNNFVPGLKSLVRQRLGNIPLSKLRIEGESFASWYSNLTRPLDPAILEALSVECFDPSNPASISEKARLYSSMVGPNCFWYDPYQTKREARAWATQKISELSPFEEVDGAPCYRMPVTDAILGQSIVSLQDRQEKEAKYGSQIVQFALSLLAAGMKMTPETPLASIESRPDLLAVLTSWSEGTTVMECLMERLPEYNPKKVPEASDAMQQVLDVLRAHTAFNASFEASLKVLEKAPEALSVILARISKYSGETSPNIVFVRMIFALPYERRRLVLDPNLTHKEVRLWHYLQKHVDLLEQIFEDPMFDLYRLSGDKLFVNHLIRETSLQKREVLGIVTKLLEVDDAAGWDGKTFPNRPECILALMSDEDAVLNLARTCKDPLTLLSGATVLRTAKESPELISMLKNFLVLHFQLAHGCDTPKDVLETLAKRIYSKAYRSSRVRNLLAKEFGFVASASKSAAGQKAAAKNAAEEEIEGAPTPGPQAEDVLSASAEDTPTVPTPPSEVANINVVEASSGPQGGEVHSDKAEEFEDLTVVEPEAPDAADSSSVPKCSESPNIEVPAISPPEEKAPGAESLRTQLESLAHNPRRIGK